MPFVRNPFRKQDENARPGASPHQPGEKLVDGINGTKPIDIKEKEPAEYKLSGMHPQQSQSRRHGLIKRSFRDQRQRSIPATLTSRAQALLVDNVFSKYDVNNEPSKCLQRERAIQHLTRVLRFIP